MNWHSFAELFKNGALITGLVLVMMIMIEYINVASAGRWFSKLRSSGLRQILLGALLGLVPGCIGGFAAVSLYSHGIITFGALIAAMISSSGDEAFVMLAMIPKDALILFAVLFVLALLGGYLTDLLYKKAPVNISCDNRFDLHAGHKGEMPSLFSRSSYQALRHPSKEFLITVAGLSLFIAALFSGLLEHEHIHHGEPVHLHDHSFSFLEERWMNILFASLSVVVLWFVTASSDHFVKDHIWGHVVRKHALKIFLWTIGALAFIELGMRYVDLESWFHENSYILLLLAALVGMIPESGPNMIFITLFAGGTVPFSVLLTNSISQDGHTSLPLLASSKRGFIVAKLLNALFAIVVGTVAFLLGF